MDFCNAGVTEHVGDAFRAHVQWRHHGKQRHAYGPRRQDEEAAKGDLESMRATASGKDREQGFAAMEAEAKRLREKLESALAQIDRGLQTVAEGLADDRVYHNLCENLETSEKLCQTIMSRNGPLPNESVDMLKNASFPA